MKILCLKSSLFVNGYMSLSLAKILKPLLLSIFLVISTNISLAQNVHSSSKKVIRNFEKAKSSFLNKDYDKSLSYVNEAIRSDSSFTDAILLKAELLTEMNDDLAAIETYELLFKTDSMAFPRAALALSKLYDNRYVYDKSVDILQWFLSLNNQKESLREYADSQLQLCLFRKELFENPVEYNPRNLGDVVNTSADEYVNQYYVNESKLIFTKRYNSDSPDDIYLKENIFVTNVIDSIFTIPVFLFEGKNADDLGAANISADGNTVYFSICGREDGLGSCDIYYSELRNGQWSKAINLRAINTSSWESQPCISHDGNELYFVRLDSRKGTSDIFVSKRNGDGTWNEAERLNPNVNSDGNEMAPFIHHDGKTLYFSSDGHKGMGGYDLFVARRDDNSDWTESENLGYPINTNGDEINLVVSNDAVKAFISAERADGYGGYDIYEFELKDEYRPQAVEIEIPSVEDLYATAMRKGTSISLRDIYFEFDSYELRQDSEKGLDALATFLNDYPDVGIELSGHTDDMGDEEYNWRLSERRAESVREALINKGISSDRIKTKGCGSSQPLFPNNFDDELRALNRRVSMTFVKEF